ncbi:MAG TPA: hypothetical protein VIV06_05875, partial [Candidatus Limnocylindrales bacterium]
VVLLLLERLATARGWAGLSSAGIPVLTWFVLTAMALWCVAVVAFVLVHGLLFAFGTDAASVGLVAAAAALVGTPVVTAVLVRRRTTRGTSQR